MSRNYRARWHDYRSRCIYHITLMKSPEMPPFGRLAGSSAIRPGQPGAPYIACTELGEAVKIALRQISAIHPALRLYQYAIMPDHIHLLLCVEHEMDEILGRKIAIIKSIVNNLTGMTAIFEHGFNDQILKPGRNLDTIYRYIRENPYRLAVRRDNPSFFERRSNLTIDGTACSAYGNMQLLDNPFKEQVVVHRADSDTAFAANRDAWLHTAANGGVLASPFISKREKQIRLEAEALGGRFILVTDRPFADREKPAGRDFGLCACGRMLIIAPAEALPFGRSACLKMNAIARGVCLR